MNQVSLDRITQSAIFLGTPEAWKHREYLADPLQLALKILEAFQGSHATYEELAQRTSFHKQTIKQVVWALEKGGYPFVWSLAKGACPTREAGRPAVAINLTSWQAKRDLAIKALEPLTRRPKHYDVAWKADVLVRSKEAIQLLSD